MYTYTYVIIIEQVFKEQNYNLIITSKDIKKYSAYIGFKQSINLLLEHGESFEEL